MPEENKLTEVEQYLVDNIFCGVSFIEETATVFIFSYSDDIEGTGIVTVPKFESMSNFKTEQKETAREMMDRVYGKQDDGSSYHEQQQEEAELRDWNKLVNGDEDL